MERFLGQLFIARNAILDGVLHTVLAASASILAGSLLGVLLGVGLAYGGRAVRWPCRGYVDVIRGTPVLVLVLAGFYMPSVVGLSLTPMTTGILALTLFCGAHVGEIVRGALNAIPPGQIEAGRALGLSFPKIFVLVLMPQALRQVLPTWINTGAEIVKASTLLSIIGVPELLLKTQEIVARNYLTLQFYVFAGLIYFVLNLAIERLGKAVERRLARQAAGR